MYKLKSFLLCFLFVTVFLCGGAKNIEKITFCGNEYFLTFSTIGAGGGYFNEYTKKGQNVKNRDEMIIIHNFPKANSPLTEIKKVAAFVTAMYAKSKTNTKPPVELSYNEKSNAAIVDFIIPDQTGLEFNAFKYGIIENEAGVTAFQYSKKYKSAQVKENPSFFQEDLIETRKTILPALAEIEIPNVVKREIKDVE